jgi:S1-C subfamily serine protease
MMKEIKENKENAVEKKGVETGNVEKKSVVADIAEKGRVEKDGAGKKSGQQGLGYGAKFLVGVWFLILCVIAGFGGAAIYQQFLGVKSTTELSIKSEGDAISSVVDKVGPSVVSIVVSGKTQSSSIYDWYFGNGEKETQGAGTGLVISEDGYIVTNKHVVAEGTTAVTVVMRDGTEYTDVEIVGRDPLNDIAFLKIKGVSGLTPAEFGDSTDLKQGQKVVAIGNALGAYQNTVTAGIIGGIGRTVTASDSSGSGTTTLNNLLQTDAAINFGNSGGPLATLDGKVIGINTAIAADAEGLGFAIPTSEFRGMLESVLKNGKVERAYLGVMYVSLTKAIASEYNLPVEAGAYINSSGSGSPIVKGGPADKAGLRNGDIIVKVGDTAIDGNHSLTSVIGRYSAGATVELVVWRGDQEITVRVTLEEYKG